MTTSGSTFTDWQQLEGDRPLVIDDDFSWSDVPARRSRPTPALAAPRPAHSRSIERQGDSDDSLYVPAERRAQTRGGQARDAKSQARDAQPQARETQARETQSRNAQVQARSAQPQTRDAQLAARRTEAEFEQARGRWSAAYERERPRVKSFTPAPAARPSFDADAEGFDRDDAASYATARVLEDRSGALDLRHSGRRTVIITGRGDSRYTLAPARRRSSELSLHERAVFNPDRTAKWAVLLGIALLIGCIAH